MKPSLLKKSALITALSLWIIGLGHAALFRFQAREQALRDACIQERTKLGITDTSAIKSKYPTPEIQLVSGDCILPGKSGEISVQGKFAPNTKFVIESDNLEVLSETLTAGTYRATVKAAAGIGPEDATIWAITPVSGITARKDAAVVVGGRYQWNLKARNGWRIVAQNLEDQRCTNKNHQGDNNHEISFYRGEEKTPFEKRQASLHYTPYGSTSYTFSIDQTDTAMKDSVGDMSELFKKLGDPKLSDPERDKLMKQMEKMQSQMQESLTRMTDPAYYKKLEQQKQQFGCEQMALALKSGTVQGSLRCSPTVGTNLEVTGTLTPLP